MADCADLMKSVGLDLFPWQKNVLEPWLAHAENGLWAASQAGLSVPRQNGKTDGCLGSRIIFGTVVYGEWVVYTAQVQKTATETFETLANFCESPALKNRVKYIKGAQGREEIGFKNGGRVKFLARTRNGGRGQHGDLLIFDEAQDLTDSQQDGFLPAISASKNPQTIYTGTPPKPEDAGSVFPRIREDALNGKTTHTSWSEWSVDEIPSNIRDEELWAKTNPSLGVLILPATIETEVEGMSEDGFARERLGWWAPADQIEPSAIDPKKWAACEIAKPPQPAPDERLACGVKFSADGSTYSVSIAAKSKKANYELVECIDRTGTARGVGGLAQWIYDRRHKLALVCVDGRSWAPTLLQKLNDMGYPKKGLHSMRTGEIIDACAMLAGAVQEENVKHIRQPLLAESVSSSPPRPIGREGWGFGGTDPTPVESAAIAYWGVNTTKRNPKRQMKVSI